MISDILLQQNPNDVNEWIRRIQLCDTIKDDSIKNLRKEQTFVKAIQKIDPGQAIGQFSKIWIHFASHYELQEEPAQSEESEGPLETCNIIFQKASQIPFRSNEELSSIFTHWAHMHVRHSNLDSSVSIAQYACLNPKSKLNMNIKCW